MRAVLPFGLTLLTLAACSPSSQPPAAGEAQRVVAMLRAHPGVSLGSGQHLAKAAAGFTIAGATSLVATLPRSAGGLVRLESAARPDVAVEIRATGLTDVAGTVADGAVVYAEVAKQTDLVLVGGAERVEEWRLLRSDVAPTVATYAITPTEAVVVRLRNGSVEIVDAEGRVHFSTEPPYAVDAVGVRRNLRVDLAHAEGSRTWTLTTALDVAGLTYPIAVDPAWTTGPGLTQGRSNHIAMRIPDGRVLVVGGDFTPGKYTGTTEAYDPVTNTFTSTGGGGGGMCQTWAIAGGTAFRFGGFLGLNPNPNVASFDPATSTWSIVGNTAWRRCRAAAAALSATRILVTGGADKTGLSDDTACEIYNVTTNTVAPSKNLLVARQDHTATTLADGSILVAGGSGAANAERYYPATDTWVATGAMKVARSGHTATLLASGRVLVIGGGGGTATELYVPSTNTWVTGGSLAHARADHAAALLSDGRVLVTGGGSAAAEIYNPATDAWSTGGTMGTARTAHQATTLADGRVLVTGNAGPAATTEIWGQLLGVSCAAAYECVSNHCVDGVCCGVASCAAGFSCSVPGKKGTCSRPIGATCSAGTECGTGNCVDGVCCNTSCTAQCGVCNAVGKVGTCSPAVGAPVGARAACTGTGVGGACGPRCDGFDLTKCTFPSATTSCGSNTCTGGIESRVGSCDGAGSCAAVKNDCAGYACGPTACLTSCAAASDCRAGYYCKGSSCVPVEGLGKPCSSAAACATGFCSDGACCGVAACDLDSSCGLPGKEGTCAKKQGATCASDLDCGSGHCVDGVCCDTACTGQCEACDVEGRVGVCAPVNGKPHGTRAPCADGGGSVCQALTCKGATDTTKCTDFASGAGVECAASKCEGTTFSTRSQCDGAGTCVAPKGSSCLPYRCDDKGCLKKCSTSAQCAPGFTCQGSRCEVGRAACTDDQLSSVGADGTKVDCAPYRCDPSGECGKVCKNSDECAPGAACDTTTGSCLPASGATDSSGGCSTGRGRGTPFGAALALLVAGVALTRRRFASLLGAGLLGCSSERSTPVEPPAPDPSDVLVVARSFAFVDARLSQAIPLERELGGFRPRAITSTLRPSVAPGSLDLVDARDPAVSLSVRNPWMGIGPSTAGLALTTTGVAQATDEVFLVDAIGVEQVLVLRSATAPTSFRFVTRHGDGIASVRLREGRIEAVDATGYVRIGSAPMYAVDAKGKRRDLVVTAEGA
ncbi:MAG: hypothetical protein JNL79_33605, partial [Myxococcales bacterium]|nr:hypothetical protein [Myxococcales bacterium]